MNKKIKGVVIILLCIVFFSSVTLIIQIAAGYRMTDALYKESAETYTAEKKTDSVKDGEDAETAPITVDFDELRKVNKDIAGWLYCEGTAINYPVMQGEDNDFYLNHTYDKSPNRAGSLFVEALNTPDFADSNTIIYGHHMKDGSMFASLRKWADQEYYEEHPVFWLLTPKQDYRVLLFGGYTTSATSDVYTIFQGPCPELGEYLKAVCARSDFRAGAEPDSNGRFVLLSTCEYDFEDARYVLHGMLVPVKDIE